MNICEINYDISALRYNLKSLAISRLAGLFVCVTMQKDMFFKRKGTEKKSVPFKLIKF